MTLDNWVNLFLILVAVTLAMKLYREWAEADSGERLCMKILGAAGVVIYVADLVLSHIG